MGLAHIHPNAIIGKNVTIEAFAYIEEDVVIGDNCWIGPYASIMNGARIGKDCKIFQGAVVSAPPQDLKYKGEKTTSVIGDRTIIREFVTINRGTTYSNTTIIGNDCMLMAYVHIAHDCIIGNNCILANNSNLAGHIVLEDFVILAGSVNISQFLRIGKHSFISGGCMLNKDIPPYIKAARHPTVYAGVNSVGLKRRGYTNEQINTIHDVYRYLFVMGFNSKNAIEKIEAELPVSDLRDEIIAFVESSKPGVLKGFNSRNDR